MSSRTAMRRLAPDVILPDDPVGKAEAERRLLKSAGGKRRLHKSSSPGSSRAKAQELHREADQLYFRYLEVRLGERFVIDWIFFYNALRELGLCNKRNNGPRR